MVSKYLVIKSIVLWDISIILSSFLLYIVFSNKSTYFWSEELCLIISIISQFSRPVWLRHVVKTSASGLCPWLTSESPSLGVVSRVGVSCLDPATSCWETLVNFAWPAWLIDSGQKRGQNAQIETLIHINGSRNIENVSPVPDSIIFS